MARPRAINTDVMADTFHARREDRFGKSIWFTFLGLHACIGYERNRRPEDPKSDREKIERYFAGAGTAREEWVKPAIGPDDYQIPKRENP